MDPNPTEDTVISKLAVFLPGNNRNWARVDGIMKIHNDGSMAIDLVEPKNAQLLVDLATNDIPFQVAFDYRWSPEVEEQVNKHYQNMDLSGFEKG